MHQAARPAVNWDCKYVDFISRLLECLDFFLLFAWLTGTASGFARFSADKPGNLTHTGDAGSKVG
jgi:hypothetical protein